MSTKPSDADKAAWAQLVKSHWAFIHARMAILRLPSAPELVRAALDPSGDLVTALAMVPYLDEEARKTLLPDLVAVASYFHGQTEEAVDRIMDLPRDWVLENIDPHVERLLQDASSEEYRALLALYDALEAYDRERRLAERAAASADAGIRQAGEDFLAGLNEDGH